MALQITYSSKLCDRWISRIYVDFSVAPAHLGKSVSLWSFKI